MNPVLKPAYDAWAEELKRQQPIYQGGIPLVAELAFEDAWWLATNPVRCLNLLKTALLDSISRTTENQLPGISNETWAAHVNNINQLRTKVEEAKNIRELVEIWDSWFGLFTSPGEWVFNTLTKPLPPET